MSKRGRLKDSKKDRVKTIIGSGISLAIIYWVFNFREFFGISLTITFGLLFAFLVFTGMLERKPFLPIYVIVASLTFRAGLSYFSFIRNAGTLLDLVISVAVVALMLVVSFKSYSLKQDKRGHSSSKSKGSKKKSKSKKGKDRR